MSNIALPRLPDDWRDESVGERLDTPTHPRDVPPSYPEVTKGGILSGLPMPSGWSLADSSIHTILDPKSVEEIDFSGVGDDVRKSGDISVHSVMADGPAPFVLNPKDIDAKLPTIAPAIGYDRRYYSAAGGTVVDSGWENPRDHNQGYGYRVRVRGDNGMLFTYGHTDPASVQVRVGEKVNAGQNLGSYGDPTNGRSTGPHSHFEVRDPSQPLQPDYNEYIKNSRSMGAIVDPTPYINTVMPNGAIRGRYGIRTMNGKREFHPGVDLRGPSF